MTEDKKPQSGRRWNWRSHSGLIVLLVLVGAGVVYAMIMRQDRGATPRPLNQQTDAREVRPFSDKPDNRFAPLPLKREEHNR